MRLLAILTTSFTLKLGRLSTVGLPLQVEVAGGVLQVPARPRVWGAGWGGGGVVVTEGCRLPVYEQPLMNGLLYWLQRRPRRQISSNITAGRQTSDYDEELYSFILKI